MTRLASPGMICLAPMMALFAATPAIAAEPALDPATAFYELRIYYPAPGKREAMNARFRDHTLRIFRKHGMTSVAYWNEEATAETPNGRLVYVLAYPSRAARETAWQAFRADPEWQAVAKASEVNGKLVDKVESIFMTRTDYSPAFALPR